MRFNRVLPSLSVRDLSAAADWYEMLLGRPADARPMESLAEWAITDTSTLQVNHDVANAGHGEVSLTVDSVDEAATTLRERGITPGDLVEFSQFVRILPLTDPDGNTINLLEPR